MEWNILQIRTHVIGHCTQLGETEKYLLLFTLNKWEFLVLFPECKTMCSSM